MRHLDVARKFLQEDPKTLGLVQLFKPGIDPAAELDEYTSLTVAPRSTLLMVSCERARELSRMLLKEPNV